MEDSNIEHVREGIGQVLGSERKSKTDTDKTLSKSSDLTEGGNVTNKENESYVGKTDNIKVSSSKRKTILPKFLIEDSPGSRYTPFTKSVDLSGSKPQTVITVNKAHPFCSTLVEAGCLDALYTMAAAMLIGPSAYDKTNEEIYSDIEKLGEMYAAINDASTKALAEAKRKKLQIVS